MLKFTPFPIDNLFSEQILNTILNSMKTMNQNMKQEKIQSLFISEISSHFTERCTANHLMH